MTNSYGSRKWLLSCDDELEEKVKGGGGKTGADKWFPFPGKLL